MSRRKDDEAARRLQEEAAAARSITHKGAGVRALAPRRAEERRSVNYRLPLSLLERLDATAEREGAGPRQKTAFLVWLLTASLDALDDGSLTPPRRETIDL